MSKETEKYIRQRKEAEDITETSQDKHEVLFFSLVAAWLSKQIDLIIFRRKMGIK